jgi:alpha-beta hydrolase superfamily lysophospholipase
LLLPGFGPQIETIVEHTVDQWVSAICESLAALQARYKPVVLVGYSLGAALVLQAAASNMPDGVVLLAPFWKIDHALWRALPALKRVLPQFRPFRLFRADFSDSNFRQSLLNFMPDADLDDPDMQAQILDLRIPLEFIDQIRVAGEAGHQIAPQITVPALIVQGTRDELVLPRLTRQFSQRFPGRLQYAEVDGDHNFLSPYTSAWRQIERAVLDFMADIARPPLC